MKIQPYPSVCYAPEASQSSIPKTLSENQRLLKIRVIRLIRVNPRFRQYSTTPLESSPRQAWPTTDEKEDGNGNGIMNRRPLKGNLQESRRRPLKRTRQKQLRQAVRICRRKHT